MAVSYVPDYLRVIAEQTAAGAAANKRRTSAAATGNKFIPEFAPRRTSQAVQEQIVPVSTPRPATSIRRESTTTQVAPPPSQTSTPAAAPVQITPAPTPVPAVTEPAPAPAPAQEAAPAEPEPTPYNVYDDPFYQQALQGAQSEFNLARIDALANQQYQERPIQRQLEDRPGVAEQQRRRLAGNFAARGMGGGRAGVLTRAEAELNAREIANRTGLREQIAELGRQFTSRFGAEGTDWLGTRAGYEAQQRALQLALQNRLGGLTTVG